MVYRMVKIPDKLSHASDYIKNIDNHFNKCFPTGNGLHGGFADFYDKLVLNNNLLEKDRGEITTFFGALNTIPLEYEGDEKMCDVLSSIMINIFPLANIIEETRSKLNLVHEMNDSLIEMVNDFREQMRKLKEEKSDLFNKGKELSYVCLNMENQLKVEKKDLSNQLDKLTEQSKTLCEELDGAQFVMDGTRHDCMSII